MVIAPDTGEALAEALRDASRQQRAVLIRGAGTKIDWGRPPQRVDVTVETRRLNRVLAHQHGDLTATIEAGATLRDVNDTLARSGQWLPLDPPFADRATIGGILATNDSGPLRHRYGTPRDLVIGVRLATADGVLAKAGGQVVKNVAGYDLSKLVTGSFGSLGAIVDATFKLAPVPPASKTIAITAPDIAAAAGVVREVMSSQLEPIAFEIAARIDSRNEVAQRFSPALLIRFASVPAAVNAQIDAARSVAGLKASTTDVIDGDREQSVWREHVERLWSAPGAIVRASWLPANIERAVADLNACTTCAVELIGRAAIGCGLIRIDGVVAEQAALIAALRHSPHVANVVIVRGSDALKASIDVWGPLGDRARLFASLKRAFDPHGILNAGRGPL